MKKIITLVLGMMLGVVPAMAGDEWTLPQYDQVSSDPADGATVRSITSVSIELASEEYDVPIGLMPGAAAVTATQDEQVIEGVTARVSNGKLVVNFSTPYTQKGDVTIHVPAGITNNLPMPVATMTPKEIFEAGGCTNPALEITLHVEPILLPIKDVTGIGYDPMYLTDEQGNYIKNDKGQYVRVDKYSSLIDAQLTAPDEDGEGGDRVTVIYFWYDEEFDHIDYKGGASVTNITTGAPIEVASVTFKTGGDSYRNNVIELRISTTDYIYSAELHQGEYEVTLPSGIATTADGVQNEGKTFRFIFGDPAKAYYPEQPDLSAFLGMYKMMSEAGEGLNEGDVMETFEVIEVDGKYYVTNLCGSTLQIPLLLKNNGFALKKTVNADGESFMDQKGDDVSVLLEEKNKKPYIYVGQYALHMSDKDIVGGIRYFERYTGDGILGISQKPQSDVIDLSGRRLQQVPQHGLYIQNGKKLIR